MSSFRFGQTVYSKPEYIEFLRAFIQDGRHSSSAEAFFKHVEREYAFYEVYGGSKRGEILLTSYFEPVFEGSLHPTEKFTQPLYKTPQDLVSLDLTKFDPKFSEERKMRARIVDRQVLPYFSREEIDVKNSLKGKKLELCWVDPTDAFFLQVQGSGTVLLPQKKEMRVGYAEKNGHPYESIGKFLIDVIPLEEMTMPPH